MSGETMTSLIFCNAISHTLICERAKPCEEASALRLQPDNLLAEGQITLSHKEHAGVALQSEGGKVAHSLPFVLQHLIDVFLQKQLPFAHVQAK